MAMLNTPLISAPNQLNPPTSVPKTLNTRDPFPSTRHVLPLLEICTSITQLKQIHAQMLRTGLFFDPYSASRLITGAALSSFSSLDYARKVFDEIPQPNIYTWNALIRGYASTSDPSQSLTIFLLMLHHCPVHPNKFTFPFVIKAASELAALYFGKGVHGMAIKGSLGSDVFILNTLIYFYSLCGDLDTAYRIFSGIPAKDVVSWNSMINGFAQGNCPERAVELFRVMELENVRPNSVTMVGVLSACAKKMDLELGKWVHSYIKSNGMDDNLILNNAVLDMYAKCGTMEEAKALFDKMPEKSIVSWTAMIDGYAKLGEYDVARRIFDASPCQDIATWNALIASYEQNGKPNEALSIFYELQRNQHVKPDRITLVSTLSACSQLGAMEVGVWIHRYIKEQGMKLNCHLGTSLIDMYTKCGDLEKAVEVFHTLDQRDVFVWSAMIAGFAMHGRGRDAIDCFHKMRDENIRPTAVTFTNLLSACSHAGLVEQGKLLFSQMLPVYGIAPEAQQYACMADVLGRAGLFEEAMDFIKSMPMAPSVSVWGAMLGACKIHGNVDLAEHAASRLLELDPRNHGAYVLLSNIYAKSGRWSKATGLRRLMRETRLKKEPGCSSIEVDGIIHEFLAGDNSHSDAKKIYTKLDEVLAKLKAAGYVPDKSHLLQIIEEDDMKEQALNLHSERLAIAFGLIRVAPSKPIRIVKNLRVCGDCHIVAKLVSKLYDREIVLRDRYRFHHFREGHCSCNGYW